MSWNKEGQTVLAKYHGQSVVGVIESSRVKYGGKVQHTVNLEQAITLRWRSEPVTRVLIDEDEVVGVFVSHKEAA